VIRATLATPRTTLGEFRLLKRLVRGLVGLLSGTARWAVMNGFYKIESILSSS
jgi:hypothetical protein